MRIEPGLWHEISETSVAVYRREQRPPQRPGKGDKHSSDRRALIAVSWRRADRGVKGGGAVVKRQASDDADRTTRIHGGHEPNFSVVLTWHALLVFTVFAQNVDPYSGPEIEPV